MWWLIAWHLIFGLWTENIKFLWSLRFQKLMHIVWFWNAYSGKSVDRKDSGLEVLSLALGGTQFFMFEHLNCIACFGMSIITSLWISDSWLEVHCWMWSEYPGKCVNLTDSQLEVHCLVSKWVLWQVCRPSWSMTWGTLSDLGRDIFGRICLLVNIFWLTTDIYFPINLECLNCDCTGVQFQIR